MREFKSKRVAWLLYLTLLLVFVFTTGEIGIASTPSQQRAQVTVESDPIPTDHKIFIPVVLNQGVGNSGIVSPENPVDPEDPTNPEPGEEPGDPGENPGPGENGEPEEPIYLPTGFEVDGNTALDQVDGIDWETSDFPPAIHIADPHSKGTRDQNVFKPDGKFDQPESWKISQGKVGPPQTELTNLWTWFIKNGDLGEGRPTDSWLLMAMERTKTEGTFYLDFEFNQMSWDGSNGGLVRSPGDLSVGFAIHGNADSIEEDLRLFIIQYYPGDQPALCSVTSGPGGKPEQVGPGNGACPAFGDYGWFYRFLGTSAELAASGLGEATMNESPFPASWPSYDSHGDPRVEIPAFQFAEAAINLDALSIQTGCATWGSVHAKGRASIQPGSDLKDLAGPVPITNNCRLEGHKYVDIDGDGVWDDGEPPWPGVTIHLTARETTTTDENGFYEFNNLQEGVYQVRESCQEGWVQTAPGMTSFDTCGTEGYEVEISGENSDVRGLDFGNGQPQLALSQSCPSDVFLGDDVLYMVELTNSGNVDLKDVHLELPGDNEADSIERLAPGEMRSLTYSLVAGEAGELVTNVTAAGTYGLATVEASDLAGCKTEVHALKVTKEARTSMDRQYHWVIDKEVDDPGPMVILRGRILYPSYTVTVGLDEPAFTEKNLQVSGTITINNPAPIVANLESVEDLLEPGLSIAVDCPALDVPAEGTLVCSYGPFSLDNANTRLNTAIVTLENNNGDTTEFRDSVEVDFEEHDTNLIDEEVDINDSLAGHLGRVEAAAAPETFTYNQTIGPFENHCDEVRVDNVATYTGLDSGTTGQATATVNVFVLCTVRIGFEDLPFNKENDWDYNDLVVDVDVEVELSGDPSRPNVDAVHLDINRLVGGPEFSGKLHEFHMSPNVFDCEGTFSMRSFMPDGTIIVDEGVYSPGDDFLIFSEDETLPVHVVLSIYFDGQAEGCPCDKEILGDPLNTFHGESLFFHPWMTTIKGGQPVTVKPGDARLLAVPDEWHWPAERQHIWLLYPMVLPGNPPTFVPYWWRS